MKFATFFHKSAIGPELVEACGDRALIVLDGRERNESHHSIAKSECLKRGYLAYRLHSGETFTRSAPTSAIIRVPE